MRKSYLIVPIFCFFVLLSCMNPNSKDSETEIETGNPTDSFYWGHWTRMDRDEAWYVGDRSVKTDSISLSVDESNETELKAGTYIFARQSENVLKVNEGEFYLYRKAGADGILTGRIIVGGDGIVSTRTARLSREIDDVASADITFINDNNELNTETISAELGVEFETPETMIPGDTYTIKTILHKRNGSQTVGPELKVVPKTNHDGIGTIVLTDAPYNFKVTGLSGSQYLFADNRDYLIDVTIANIGTETNFGSVMELPGQEFGINVMRADTTDTDPALDKSRLKTMEAGKRVTRRIAVACNSISGEYEDKAIKINVRDADNRIWEDEITLRFYAKPMNVRVASIEQPVYGVVLSPENSGTFFRTSITARDRYDVDLELPYRDIGYLISLSKATAETETVYSIGIDVETATTIEMANTYDTGAYERHGSFTKNDTEEASTPIAMNEKIIAYLHSSDIDFYGVGNKVARPTITPSSGSYRTALDIFISTVTSGANIRYTLDGSTPNITSGTLFTGPFSIPSTTAIRAIAYKNGLEISDIGAAEYSLTGTITVNIEVKNPADQNLVFVPNVLSLKQGNILVIETPNTQLSASGQNWEWYENSTKLGNTASVLNWDTTGKSIGQYVINASTELDGVGYSGALLITLTR